MVETEDPGERAALVMDLLRAIRAFGDAHDRMNSGMKHGMRMNATDLAALRLLIIREEQGRPVGAKEIARHLRISTASTTKLLDRLSRAGHVRRAPHPSDRRAVVVELTESSRQEFFRVFSGRLAAMRAAFAGFTDEQLEAAVNVLGAVSAAIDPDDGAGPDPAAGPRLPQRGGDGLLDGPVDELEP